MVVENKVNLTYPDAVEFLPKVSKILSEVKHNYANYLYMEIMKFKDLNHDKIFRTNFPDFFKVEFDINNGNSIYIKLDMWEINRFFNMESDPKDLKVVSFENPIMLEINFDADYVYTLTYANFKKGFNLMEAYNKINALGSTNQLSDLNDKIPSAKELIKEYESSNFFKKISIQGKIMDTLSIINFSIQAASNRVSSLETYKEKSSRINQGIQKANNFINAIIQASSVPSFGNKCTEDMRGLVFHNNADIEVKSKETFINETEEVVNKIIIKE